MVTSARTSFGEAGAAVARARRDEAIADAAVAADAEADVFDVHTKFFAESGDFVHEGDAGREHGVDHVFSHFGVAHGHVDEAGAAFGQRGVEGL